MKLGRFPGFAIACLILAALSGFLYWSNRHPKSDETVTPATPTAPIILNINPSNVTGLMLKIKGEPNLTLARQSGTWQIIAPQSVPADQEQVSMLLSALAPFTAQEMVASNAQSNNGLNQFGLTAPSIEVDIDQKDKPAQRLLFGDDTPVGGNTYAMLAGDPRVFTASNDSKRELNKTEMDLRDKRLITIPSDKMTSIELTHPGATLALSHTASGWALVKPQAYRTDSIAADTLADTLAGAQMQTTQPNAKDAEANFAHGTPVATVKVTGPSGTQSLEVRKIKNAEYAKSSTVPGVYQVDTSLTDGLNKNVDDFRNKQLFDFGDNEPDSIDIEGLGVKLAAVHNAQGWWQSGKKADSDSVEGVVSALRSLTATSFATSGFTTPALTISVTSKNGKLVEKAEIAKTETAKNGNQYLARRAAIPRSTSSTPA